jgi:hypothetical protein
MFERLHIMPWSGMTSHIDPGNSLHEPSRLMGRTGSRSPNWEALNPFFLNSPGCGKSEEAIRGRKKIS